MHFARFLRSKSYARRMNSFRREITLSPGRIESYYLLDFISKAFIGKFTFVRTLVYFNSVNGYLYISSKRFCPRPPRGVGHPDRLGSQKFAERRIKRSRPTRTRRLKTICGSALQCIPAKVKVSSGHFVCDWPNLLSVYNSASPPNRKHYLNSSPDSAVSSTLVIYY